MKIVGISIVRNEADVIETFVRYHLRILDAMIVVNHRSADATDSILRSIEREGLPIRVLQESGLELQQGRVLSRVMRSAVQDMNADWVLPIDADEFIVSKTNEPVRSVIQKLPPDNTVKISWRSHIPMATDDPSAPNIMKRMRHHATVERSPLPKILVPRALAAKRGAEIAAGNHALVTRSLLGKEKELPRTSTDQLALAHYPVRSQEQIMTKIFVGWLSCLSKPNKQPTENHHQKVLYDRLKSGDSISVQELTEMALFYADNFAAARLNEARLTEAPVPPEARDLELRYTDARPSRPYAVLAQIAEDFAEAAGRLRRGGAA